MKLNFRQGLAAAPGNPTPSFLTYNGGNNTITIAAGSDVVRASIAYGDANYLVEERQTVSSAWGPLNWNTAWGTDPGAPYTFYLYWDINLATGVVSRGFTPRTPEYNLVEPVAPAVDLHWFDLNVNIMKVWNGTVWVKKARVFAGEWGGGINITENNLGSQVGLTYGGSQDTWPDHGYILYGMDGNGVRSADAVFVTTSTPLMTNQGSFTSPIRLELASSSMLAAEPIPAFSCVANNGDDTASLASGTNVDKRPIGLVMTDSDVGDPVDVVTKGIVYNDQWTWDYNLGKDIYCGPTGGLVQGSTLAGSGIRIGTILSPNTILVDCDIYATSGFSGFSGVSGFSGFSGESISGFSGYSGISGWSGFSGISGWSGFSGFSGVDGASGFSGFSGVDGASGFSGFSGVDGASGFSGFSGVDGASGFSGFSGTSGYSGLDSTVSGFSGFSGFSGVNGTSGFSGFSGVDGASGFSGVDGASGFSGLDSTVSGFSGFSGVDGAAGSSGFSGFSGVDGAAGASGFSGFSGVDGAAGASGFSGFSGVGTSGFSGIDGAQGTSGFSGYSGAVSASGFSGYSGFGPVTAKGTATMVGGTVTVNTGVVTASSLIFLTVQTLGTVSTPKAVAATARVASTSFTITSADVTDTSDVAWMIIEP